MLARLTALALASLLLAPATAEAKKNLGLNVHQSSDVGLDVTRDARLGWVRIDLNWVTVEAEEGKLDFSVIDAVVDGARSRGLEVLGVVGYGPTWASTGDGKGDGSHNDVPRVDLYAAFVQSVVKHYEGRITHYELWNEPNLGEFFEGSVDDYLARVLKPGAAAVHAGCAGCKVVAPGLATVGEGYDAWLDKILAQAKDDIDIVSGHAYAGFPADEPNAGKTSDSFFNKLESHRVVQTGGAVLYEGALSFREVMDKNNVSKPFWLTETGKKAPIGDAKAEDAQRTYVRRVLEAMLQRPWWQATFFYEAFDEPSTPELTWGMALHDPKAPGGYQPKAAHKFLQQVTAAQPQFGGTATDCMDFLDNDGDGKLDHPADDGCASASAPSEGSPGAAGASGAQGGSGGSGGGQAGASGAAGTAASGKGGQGGSGLRSDLDLMENKGDDGGGCSVARGPAWCGGLALLALAGLAARRRRRAAL